jgi:hypothetical protein
LEIFNHNDFAQETLLMAVDDEADITFTLKKARRKSVLNYTKRLEGEGMFCNCIRTILRTQ